MTLIFIMGMDTTLSAILIITALQLLGFTLAFSFRTDKFTDLFYGSSFAIAALFILLSNKVFYLAHILLFFMVAIWGLRLSLYLFKRIKKIKKDTRFDAFRHDFFKFGGFWLLQAAAIIIIGMPAFLFLGSDYSGLGFFGFAGILIWLAGFLTEAVADHQKFIFKKKNPNSWIQSGLWKYSRHPNYFGEIVCWIGVFIYAMPGLRGLGWLSIASPVFVTVLLLYVSGIPLLEKKYDEKYGKNPDYAEYKERTSILVPMPPKRI